MTSQQPGHVNRLQQADREMVKKPASKKTPRSKSAPQDPITAQDDPSVGPQLDPAEQQRILAIFEDAFESVLSSESFPLVLQEIKQALYNREFAVAFSKEEYLEAYAARWSPTRALGYAEIFLRLRHHIDEVSTTRVNLVGERKVNSAQCETEQDSTISPSDVGTKAVSVEKSNSSEAHNGLRMLSVGGCAAEHVAFAAYLHNTTTRGHLSLLDSGPWSQVTDLLQSCINSPPKLSKYASAAAKSANRPLLEPSTLSVDFAQRNVLDLTTTELADVLGTGPLIFTLLFTLNELYTVGGLGKTTKFLKSLGELMAHGSLLLVVDSPGSYSEAAIGQEKKRYPMQWLLNHTLVETEATGYEWETLESDDSTWFRVSEDLTYPIPLENMRYQLHLYRLLKT